MFLFVLKLKYFIALYLCFLSGSVPGFFLVVSVLFTSVEFGQSQPRFATLDVSTMEYASYKDSFGHAVFYLNAMCLSCSTCTVHVRLWFVAKLCIYHGENGVSLCKVYCTFIQSSSSLGAHIYFNPISLWKPVGFSLEYVIHTILIWILRREKFNYTVTAELTVCKSVKLVLILFDTDSTDSVILI